MNKSERKLLLDKENQLWELLELKEEKYGLMHKYTVRARAEWAVVLKLVTELGLNV